MNPVIERFKVADGTLRRKGLPIAMPKGLVFRALLRSGWRGVDGALPEEVARRLRENGPIQVLLKGSQGSGKVA